MLRERKVIGEVCSTCCFFQLGPALNSRVGQCRIHAPILIREDDGRLRTVWPLIGKEEWCGDHAVFEEEET